MLNISSKQPRLSVIILNVRDLVLNLSFSVNVGKNPEKTQTAGHYSLQIFDISSKKNQC